MSEVRRAKHLSVTDTITVAPTGDYAEIGSIVVGTGAASATLTITETSTSTVVAVIDCSAKGLYPLDVLCRGGFTAVLAGGHADVTLTYT